MRKASPETYGAFLARAEEEFKRLGYREKISQGVENILIVRFDIIGDMVLTSGFIREVRANFPKANITLVVEPAVYSIVEFCPYVNEVLYFARGSLSNNLTETLERIVFFCKEHFWHKKFSLAFCPKFSAWKLPALWMAWLSGARERIGYGVEVDKDYALDKFLLTKNVIAPKAFLSHTYAEITMYTLLAGGYTINQTHMELFYTEADVYQARELLRVFPKSYKKVLIGIGASEKNRKYPIEKYLIALRELVKKELCFVIVGGKSEIDDAEFLEKNLPKGKVLNLVGKTTLRETEAIVSQADFYLGNVTGIMHMAAAEKIPILCIYREAKELDNLRTGNEFVLFPPYQTKFVILRPQHQLDDCATSPPFFGFCMNRKEPHCITQITPQEIIAGFEKLEEMV